MVIAKRPSQNKKLTEHPQLYIYILRVIIIVPKRTESEIVTYHECFSMQLRVGKYSRPAYFILNYYDT